MQTVKDYINGTFKFIAELASGAANEGRLHLSKRTLNVIANELNGVNDNVDAHSRELTIFNDPSDKNKVWFKITPLMSISRSDPDTGNLVVDVSFKSYVHWRERPYDSAGLKDAFDFAREVDELARFAFLIESTLHSAPEVCVYKTSEDIAADAAERLRAENTRVIRNICNDLCKTMRVGNERQIPFALVKDIPHGIYKFTLNPYGDVRRTYEARIRDWGAWFKRLT